MKYLILLAAMLFATSIFAQDTTRINAGDKPQYQQDPVAQHQKQQRANRVDKFVDKDGDGINDEIMDEFLNKIRTQKRTRTNDGDGEMNRNMNQNRNQNGAAGPSNGEPIKTQTKKSEGKK